MLLKVPQEVGHNPNNDKCKEMYYGCDSTVLYKQQLHIAHEGCTLT